MNASRTVKAMPGAGQVLAISLGPRGPRPEHGALPLIMCRDTKRVPVPSPEPLRCCAAIPGAPQPPGERRTEDDERVTGPRALVAGATVLSASAAPGSATLRRPNGIVTEKLDIYTGS